MDVFDRAQLVSLVREAHPKVIIHHLTGLSAGNRAANARLWKEGTRNLVEAAQAAGVRQFIAQSIAWVSPPGAGPGALRASLPPTHDLWGGSEPSVELVLPLWQVPTPQTAEREETRV